ncbi:GMP synthase [glutamine-hydrolyzing] [Daphnia magna]|uniref:GMPS ATP-PPase domain-containing protein n=1 Tax=Daphnia magna TaxID=35525 RepID=A0ABQ9ZNU7_9CRUS|nr:GMP synthase [glutamine-hydrolyzing] [Daphnia magna]KAK4014608.1 hypothetical protein OUZ56_027126 [Daphnia magna]
MLHNFLFDMSGLQGGFTLEKREQLCIDYIRRTVGRDNIVLMLVRGGVDSAVCVALLHKALLQGDDSSQVQDIHIDNGFLRKDESEQVVNSLQQLRLNLRVIFLDRSEYYDWPKCDTKLIGASSCHISISTVYNTCSTAEFFYRQWLLIFSSYLRLDSTDLAVNMDTAY